MAQDVGCSAVYRCLHLDLGFYCYGSFSLLELCPIDSVLDPGPLSFSACEVNRQCRRQKNDHTLGLVGSGLIT